MSKETQQSTNEILLKMQSSFGYSNQAVMLEDHFDGDLEAMVGAAKRFTKPTEANRNKKKQFYVTEYEIVQDVRVVQEIIEAELESYGNIYKGYVIELLKVRLNPSHLHNMALAAGKGTKNGMRNIDNGAKAVFFHSMKRLRDNYVVGRTGLIKRRADQIGLGILASKLDPSIRTPAIRQTLANSPNVLQ